MISGRYARANTTIDQETFWRVVDRLDANGYPACWYRSRRELLSTAGFDSDVESMLKHHVFMPPESSSVFRRFGYGDVGELFTDASTGSFYYLRLVQPSREPEEDAAGGPLIHAARNQPALEAGYLFNTELHEGDAFTQFQDAVGKAYSEVGHKAEQVPLKWTSIHPAAPAFAREPANTIPPTPDEIRGAQQLADDHSRLLIREVKKVGVITVSGIRGGSEKLLSPAKIGRTVTALVNAGLLTKEVLVICTSTRRVVNRLESRAQVNRLSRTGVRCSCGRRIAEEEVEEGIALTDCALALTDHSRWMTVLCVQELLQAGLEARDILVEQTTGPDEVDVLANVFGWLLLIELKDREFSFGDTNTFSTRMLRYDADYGLVVTTQTVSPDAKQVIDDVVRRTRERVAFRGHSPQAAVDYVEGLSTMPSVVRKFVSARGSADVSRMLSRLKMAEELDLPQLVLTSLQKPPTGGAFGDTRVSEEGAGERSRS